MGNHGGKREGAGRKPKADEVKLIEKLDKVIDSDDVIKKLMELVNKGNYNAIKLYMEYRYGKPKEKVDVTTDGGALNIPVISFRKSDEGD